MLNIPFRVDPEFFVFPYLTKQGLAPYTQIIDQHFPGGFFLPINFATLGFTDVESFLSLHILIVLLMALLIYKITKKFTAVSLFLILWPFFDGFHLWIDTFISLSLLAAYYFFSSKKYLLASLSLAFGLLFKQTILLPIVFLSFFSLKILIFPVILLCYLFSVFPFQDFLYWTFTFNFTAYNATTSFPLPKWLILFLPTLTLIKKQPWLFALLLLTVPGFIARPDLVHLQPAAPFLILLLFYFIQDKLKKYLLPIIISLLLLSSYKISKTTNQNLYFDSNNANLISGIKDLTSEGDEVFLLGAQPHIYMQSKTLPAGRYFVYHLPWYLKLTEATQLEVLQNNPPKLVVFDTSASVNDTSISAYAPKLIDYIRHEYRRINSIGNYEIYLYN